MGAPEVVACYQNRRQGSCEWLHFMIQDHHNAFDATPQSPGEGAFHDIASKFFLDVPLVVGLSTSNHGTLFTEYVGEMAEINAVNANHSLSLKCFQSGRISTTLRPQICYIGFLQGSKEQIQ